MDAPSIVRIRQARPADAAPIAQVYVEAWRSAYAGILPTSMLVRMSARAQEREWARQLSRRRPLECILAAELAGHGLIGFGSCGPARDSVLAHAGEVYTLYVAPEHHERGTGRMLVLALFDALLDRGLNSAVVWVLERNPARFFYEAMGGQRIAVRCERLWNANLPQAAYGWDDLRLVRDRSATGD